MVQTRKHAECEQWCNRLKTIQGLPYWCERRTAGDGSNKLYRIWGVEIQNERRCWEWNFETLPQYGLWLTAGAGAANLCQRDTRCRCQVLGTESLLLSSRWSLCAVKCHSKESDRAAPYAFWNCHPNLFPVLWNQARTYKNNQNTQLVATDSILISTRSFIILIFSLILTSLFSRNTWNTLHSALDIPGGLSCSQSNMLSFLIPPFVCCCWSRHLRGLTATPKRPLGSSVLLWVPTLARSFERRLNSRVVYVLESDTGLSSQIPGSIRINRRIPFCGGNCLGMS